MPPTRSNPTRSKPLDGLSVCIAGRLASMPRREAMDHIRAAGGEFAERVTRKTDLLVRGRGGKAADEGAPEPRNLSLARELVEQGAAILIVQEEELLERLGLDERRVDMRRLHTTAQLARILDVPAARIRSWIRHGLIHPARTERRIAYFEFQQVAIARALTALSRAGVGDTRIKRSLELLRGREIDPEEALAQLEADAGDGELVLRHDDGSLVEPSGQLHMDFGEPAAGAAAPGAGPALRLLPGGLGGDAQAFDPNGPEIWFERATQAEGDGQLQEAADLYAHAFELAPDAETAFNLGNCQFGTGRHEEAVQSFLAATGLNPDFADAWNNLGIVLGELARSSEAESAFRRAVTLDPGYADAHFSLGEILAARGKHTEARRAFHTYLALDPSSPWSDEVRKRIAELGQPG